MNGQTVQVFCIHEVVPMRGPGHMVVRLLEVTDQLTVGNRENIESMTAGRWDTIFSAPLSGITVLVDARGAITDRNKDAIRVKADMRALPEGGGNIIREVWL